MIEITGHIVAAEPAGLWVKAAPASCGSCRSDCHTKTSLLYLPLTSALSMLPPAPSSAAGFSGMPLVVTGEAEPGSSLVLGLDSGDGLKLLLHSLLLPLAGLLTGVSVASYFSLADSAVLAGAVIGFATGLTLCQIQSLDNIQIKNKVGDS
jgi:positive regulator of sigma E activity